MPLEIARATLVDLLSLIPGGLEALELYESALSADD